MIVLDTHVFLWYALDDPHLSEDFKLQLAGQPTQVAVPSICFWEAMLLIERNRIEVESNQPVSKLRSYLEASGFSEAPLTVEIAMLSRVLEFEHEDPADRFIAATAHALGATLATSDARLRSLSWVRLAY